MSGLVTAMHLRADMTVETFEYDPLSADGLDELQRRVGGWLEAAPVIDPRLTLYVNEEGKLNGLPGNVLATALLAAGNPDVIVGDAVLVGAPDAEGNDTTLPAYAIEAAWNVVQWVRQRTGVTV